MPEDKAYFAFTSSCDRTRYWAMVGAPPRASW